MGFRVVRSLTSETTPVKLCDLNVYVHGAGVIGIDCMGIRLYWYGNEVSKKCHETILTWDEIPMTLLVYRMKL